MTPMRLLSAAAAAVILLATAPQLPAADVNAPPPELQPGRHPMIPHDHSPEMTEKLKTAIPVFQTIPDRALHAIMNMMRADYAWYISPPGVRSKTGVLILNHGVSEESDVQFREQLAPLAKRRPTAIAFGMAMTTSEAVQQAIDDLNAQGVDRIIAIDSGSSVHKSLYRQWHYILGLRDQAAYVAVPQVKSKARILMAEPMNDDPVIAGILLDHAKAKSKKRSNETVIIIAHGPEDDVDNPPDLAEVQKLARQVKRKGGFASVEALNIQDDAPREVRARNVETFRKLVSDARAQGRDVIVVPYVINAKGLQPKLQKDLEGLEYHFEEKGLSDHPDFLKWIEKRVKETLRKI
jgi:16S rRNA U1498 N3-methylase RsmE